MLYATCNNSHSVLTINKVTLAVGIMGVVAAVGIMGVVAMEIDIMGVEIIGAGIIGFLQNLREY